jgi:SAM-dependent methyltransferase
VTVEICQLQWPRGTHLLALDRSEAMIHGVWPGKRNQTICGDWLAMPLMRDSRDVVFCDGGVTTLPYPDGTRRLVASLMHVLAPGGVCALRLYVPPAEHEPTAAVLGDLLAGRIANLNLLKLRLGMSLQPDPRTGVELRAIWNAIHSAAPDFGRLAARIGWDIDHFSAINTYRDSVVRYYFPTAADVLAVFAEHAPAFALQQFRRPSYELGECCPMIVFRKG